VPKAIEQSRQADAPLVDAAAVAGD
jgi:hypothetical protein